ncbi:SWIM-type domain-containing protein [Gammaproteobacteria bacterium]
MTDAVLSQVIPSSLLDMARRQLMVGLMVEVRRQAAGEPCDTARLPTATVRFWAGAALESARCDCIQSTACEHLALAVWAFRFADLEHPGRDVAQIRLGRLGDRLELDQTSYLALVEALLHSGVSQGTASLSQPLSMAKDAARMTGAIWLSHLLDELDDWRMAYANRSALYQMTRGVDLVAELALRTRAGGLPGQARQVLGMGQPAETELDRVRLVCLGARTLRDGDGRQTRLVMADLDTGTRLVLVKEWRVAGDQLAREAAIRSAERLAPGVWLERLAQGQLLARQAKRLADGTLKLAKARTSQNSVLPQAADWGSLGVPLRFSSVGQLVAHQRENPVYQCLPRHAAGQFVIFTPQQVEQVFYDPNDQALVVLMTGDDPVGEDEEWPLVCVRRVHESHVGHALDAVAGAFTGQFGLVRQVAGLLNWHQGLPVIEPWAMACDNVIVPDFSPACGALAQVALGHAPIGAGDPIVQGLRQLKEVMASLLHYGIRSLPQGWARDGSSTLQELRLLGLNELAQRLEVLTAKILAAQARPASEILSPGLMEMLAIMQLHEQAHALQ